jgi:hypothetical protein
VGDVDDVLEGVIGARRPSHKVGGEVPGLQLFGEVEDFAFE